MRTNAFRTILSGLALVVSATGASAQDRAGLLTSIEVKQLGANPRTEDHTRLRNHFAALADKYATDARRSRAFAHTMTGNPNHPPAVAPSVKWMNRAERSEAAAETVRALAAHHDHLASGRPSQAPPGGARFVAGEGAPIPTPAQLAELAASARTPAQHRSLAEYYTTLAEQQTIAAHRYASLAQTYQAQMRKGGIDPAIHFDQLANRSRAIADHARVEAAKHAQAN